VTNATHRLLEEALTLGPEERAALAAELLASLEESEDRRVELEVASEWPKGFFEEVVGGRQGEPLDRPEQGHAEPRDRL
jgi:hypothetical protein